MSARQFSPFHARAVLVMKAGQSPLATQLTGLAPYAPSQNDATIRLIRGSAAKSLLGSFRMSFRQRDALPALGRPGPCTARRCQELIRTPRQAAGTSHKTHIDIDLHVLDSW